MSFYHVLGMIVMVVLLAMRFDGGDVSAGEIGIATIAFCVSARINEIERDRRKREEAKADAT